MQRSSRWTRPTHTHDNATPHRRRDDTNYDKDYSPWPYATNGSYDHDANDEYDDGADNEQITTLSDEREGHANGHAPLAAVHDGF